MNNSYTGENGGRKEVSGKTESRRRISTDVRNALALFIGGGDVACCRLGCLRIEFL